MSLISDFATQQVTLERFIEEDPQFHESTYEDPETILAVFEPASGTVRTATGAQVQVESRILTETELNLNDLIEGSRIVRVDPVIYFDGGIIGYEAFL